jgi:hypothetical protein
MDICARTIRSYHLNEKNEGQSENSSSVLRPSVRTKAFIPPVRTSKKAKNNNTLKFTESLTTTGMGRYDRTGRQYRGKKHTKSNIYKEQVRKIQKQTQT